MRLLSGRITWGPCVVSTLLLQDVSTLMYFCVAPVSAIPYVGLLLCVFPIQLLQLLFNCVKYYSTLVISLLINILLFLYPVLDPNCHAPFGMSFILLPILFNYFAFSLCPSTLYLHFSLSFYLTPWV